MTNFLWNALKLKSSPTMTFLSSNIYVVLITCTVAETSIFSLLPRESVSALEVVTSGIIQRYLPIMYDVQFICEKACVPDELLKTIRIPVRFSKPHLRTGSFLFLLPQSSSFVNSMLDEAVNSTRSKFVVLLECGGCVSPEWVLLQCWQRKILNVVVIPIENETLPIYTYIPFRKDGCFNPEPVLLTNFNASTNFSVELFPPWKMWDLHKCTLIVSSFNQYPHIYFEDGKLKGRFSPVFDAVANSMNFKSVFIHTDGEGWYGSASEKNKVGIRGDVFLQRAHLGFTFLHPIDFNYLDYDTLARTGCLTWCLASTFKKHSLWWLIVGEFSPSVWVMLIISAGVLVATDFVIQKFENWLYGHESMDSLLLAALFQKASERMPRYSAVSFRVLWIAWLMVSLVISTVYLSTLKSLRTAPYREYAVRTLQDVADAGLQAWYHKGFAALVDLASESNPAVAKLKTNSFKYPPVMTGELVDLFKYRNVTGLVVDKMCWMWSEMNGVDMYPVPDDCMQVMPWHLFVMSKNSIFTEEINAVLGRLMQAGIVQRALKDKKKSSRSADMKKRAISLTTMMPAFLLMGWGLVVSVLLFFFELVLVGT